MCARILPKIWNVCQSECFRIYMLASKNESETEQLQTSIDECLVSPPAARLPIPAANRTLCEQVDLVCYERVIATVEPHDHRNRFDFRLEAGWAVDMAGHGHDTAGHQVERTVRSGGGQTRSTR
jgi:hypothetical protein